MLSAIVDPNPVLVLLPKALLRVRGEQADPRRAGRRGGAEGDASTPPSATAATGSRAGRTCEPYFVPLGVAALVREGDDATVVSYGRTLPLCVQAADELAARHGQRCDVHRPAQHLPLRLEGHQRAACGRRAGC